MATEKPTVFITHGAWHTPAHWGPMMKLLRANNFPTACLPCPTSNFSTPINPVAGSVHSQISHLDDVAFLRPHLTDLIYQGKEVLVLGHSYGGWVASHLVTRDLTVKERSKKGLKGGVIGVLFVSAIAATNGIEAQPMIQEALKDDPRAGPSPWMHYNAETGLIEAKDAGPIMYNNMSEADQAYWISLCTSFSPSAVTVPQVDSCVYFTPTSYLVCRKDEGIFLPVQEYMIKQFEDQGVEIRRAYCDADHSPYLSEPQTVVDEIEKSIDWSRSKVIEAQA